MHTVPSQAAVFPSAIPPDPLSFEILKRLEALETKIDAMRRDAEPITTAAQAVPPAIAGITDGFDAWVRSLHTQDIDLESRLQALGRLGVRLTEPEVVQGLESLLAVLPTLSEWLQAVPSAVNIAVDSFDTWIAQGTDRGLHVERIASSLATVATRLSDILQSSQFKALMDSGVLHPQTLEVIGQAGQALAQTHAAPSNPTGAFKAVRSLGQPDVQHALGFLVTFAQHFGRHLHSDDMNQLPATSENAGESA